MLKQYIILFVLVILMVKTNAQSPFFYNKSQKIYLTESDDKMLIRISRDITSGNYTAIHQRIDSDINYHLFIDIGEYIVLKKDSASSISKADALSHYINLEGLMSISFAYDHSDGAFQAASNEVVIQLKTGGSVSQIWADAAAYYPDSIVQDEFMPDIYHAFFPKTSSISILDIANNLYETDDFEFSVPDFFRSIKESSCTSTTIHDPLFQYQWGLYNPSTTSPFTGCLGGCPNVANADINVCPAWTMTNALTSSSTLSNITVAVIDEGVDPYHPDLNVATGTTTSTYIGGFDALAGIGSSGTPLYPIPGAPSVGNEHGTECAGIIGALANNMSSPTVYTGIVGVAPNVTIVPVRIWYRFSISGILSSDNYVAKGIEWAAGLGAPNHPRVDIMNCSWGGTYTSMSSPYTTAAITAAINAGCTLVFSTGNEDDNITANPVSKIYSPAGNPGVIAVGAMTMCNERKYDAVGAASPSCDGQVGWASHYGYGWGYSSSPADPKYAGHIAIVAPGVDIYTTTIHGGTSGDYNPAIASYGTRNSFSGTSASAPFVAGVAALMLY